MDDTSLITCAATERALESETGRNGHPDSAGGTSPAQIEESPLEQAAEPFPPADTPPADDQDAPRVQSVDPPAKELEPRAVIEALLFASDAPLSAARLAELLGAGTVLQVRLYIADLNQHYACTGASFRIESIARGYQMLTLPAFRPWLAKLEKQRSQTRLSEAALETLSIVAYKQPIIRADIEAIRGVACGDVLNRLRDMKVVRVVGRAEVVGRPILYGTTRKFLDVFGLADLDDLPPMEALKLRPPSVAPEAEAPATPEPEAPDPIGEPHAAAGA